MNRVQFVFVSELNLNLTFEGQYLVLGGKINAVFAKFYPKIAVFWICGTQFLSQEWCWEFKNWALQSQIFSSQVTVWFGEQKVIQNGFGAFFDKKIDLHKSWIARLNQILRVKLIEIRNIDVTSKNLKKIFSRQHMLFPNEHDSEKYRFEM